MRSSVIPLLLCFVAFTFTKDLPSYFPRCYRDDPKMWECLVKATNIMRPYLGHGIPEISLPPIQAFTVPTVELEQRTPSLKYKTLLNNVTFRGLQGYDFKNLSFDQELLELFAKVVIEKLQLVANYSIKGQILIAPIQGEGIFTANLTNIESEFVQKCKIQKRKGEKYLQPLTTNFGIIVGGASLHFQGLFNGNEDLGRVTNEVINGNVKDIIREIKPVIENVVSKIAENTISKMFSAIPYDNLFPLSQ